MPEELQLLCAICGDMFAADVPNDVGHGRCDAATVGIIARLEYGGGFPFSRREHVPFSAGASRNGATVADVPMSTLYTAERAGKSCLHYPAALHECRAELAARPQDWMP